MQYQQKMAFSHCSGFFLVLPSRVQTRKKNQSYVMLSIERDTFFKHILGFSHEPDIQTNRGRVRERRDRKSEIEREKKKKRK